MIRTGNFQQLTVTNLDTMKETRGGAPGNNDARDKWLSNMELDDMLQARINPKSKQEGIKALIMPAHKIDGIKEAE